MSGCHSVMCMRGKSDRVNGGVGASFQLDQSAVGPKSHNRLGVSERHLTWCESDS